MRRSKDDALTKEEFERLWEAAKAGDEKDRLIFYPRGPARLESLGDLGCRGGLGLTSRGRS
jgi:hypothetical protein